jgi:protein SCO1/2
VAACGNRPALDFLGTDLSNQDFGRRLELTDHEGRRRSLDDFRGKVVALSFGYTHCPDVCPTTLSDTAAALALLSPKDAARVQVLFVTVDPERDSAEMLKHYVPYFHPTFLGLRGSEAELAAVTKEFKVFRRKHVMPGANGYTVDHTAGSFVFDTTGKLRLLLPFAMSPQDMAHDLGLMLRGG